MSRRYKTCPDCGGYFPTEGSPPWVCPRCSALCNEDEPSREPLGPGNLTPSTLRHLFWSVLVFTPLAAAASWWMVPWLISGMVGGVVSVGGLWIPALVLGAGSAAAGWLAARRQGYHGAALAGTSVIYAIGFFGGYVILLPMLGAAVGFVARAFRSF